tara:strand:- start:1602 stop:2129 length:528 start_codon:yes stop_codon:yes gene_type:complete
MTILRREKTTKNADDNRVLIFGVLAAIFLMALPGLGRAIHLDSQRWYRDLMGLTPFHGTEVLYAEFDGNTVTIGGYMIKDRCVFDYYTGYIIDSRGIRHPVVVDDSPEVLITGVKSGSSRPPSDTAEAWGPWTLTTTQNIDQPTGWEIHVDHKDCPSPPVKQSNLFTSGSWGSAL